MTFQVTGGVVGRGDQDVRDRALAARLNVQRSSRPRSCLAACARRSRAISSNVSTISAIASADIISTVVSTPAAWRAGRNRVVAHCAHAPPGRRRRGQDYPSGQSLLVSR